MNMWNEVGENLRKRIGEPEFRSWVEMLTLRSIEEKNIIIEAPSRFIKDWVDTNLLYEIQKSFHECFPETKAKKIEIIIEPNNNRAIPISVQPEQEVIKSDLNPLFTFDNFVVGKPNEFAYAASLRVAESKKVDFNPLFLYGGVGLGKTHLMHAIANKIKETHQNRRVVYVSAEKFMYKFIKALRNKDTVSFKDEFRNIDVLMVDDVQFFSTANATQEEFFHTLNHLITNNKQIIISADKSPSDLENVEERLKSRLNSGLVADIHPTTYELRLGILQSKSERLNVQIQDKVLEFLASKIVSNVRELEGALNRVVVHTELFGKPIDDLDAISDILKDVIKSNDKGVSANDIQKRVAEFYGIKVADIKSACRRKTISRPRQIAMYFCKEFTTLSLPEIGRVFGGKDHTSVMYAIKNIRDCSEKDRGFNDEINLIRKTLVS